MPANKDHDSSVNVEIPRSRQFFVPSEFLHSKALPSEIIEHDFISSGASPSSSGVVANSSIPPSSSIIAVCYRDGGSFYKSSRKASRIAKRVWSAFADEDSTCSSSSSIRDGYWIGRKTMAAAAPGCNNGSKNDFALHRRLALEFGPCVIPESDLSVITSRNSGSMEKDDVIKSFDSTNLKMEMDVMKFSFDGKGEDSSKVAANAQNRALDAENGIHVIFMDLDTLAQDHLNLIFDDPNASSLCCHSLLEGIISTLTKQSYCSGKNFIINVKCDSLHRAISSMASLKSSANNSDAVASVAPLTRVSGVELTMHLSSHNCADSPNPDEHDNATAATGVIRRLRGKKRASHCPLSLYPARFVEIPPSTAAPPRLIEICRFHNYDLDRGCLRSKKAQQKQGLKGCDMDHDHCHECGHFGHKAFECARQPSSTSSNKIDASSHLQSVVFQTSQDGSIISVPLYEYHANHSKQDEATHSWDSTALPAVLVLGGRLRGRTLATCEMLPQSSLSSSTINCNDGWKPLPNLLEHRGR